MNLLNRLNISVLTSYISRENAAAVIYAIFRRPPTVSTGIDETEIKDSHFQSPKLAFLFLPFSALS